MRITRYGIDVVVVFFAVAALIVAASFLFIEGGLLRVTILLVVAVLAMLVLNFFRDPDRVVPDVPGAVVSPADGRIVVIRDVHEPDYMKQEAIQVSIFMSPLDVHVNRFPISGVVRYFRHIPGEFLVAYDDKASERNERTVIGMEQNGIKVLFRQIAGKVARRIVARVNVETHVVRGERFGMIRFGSRVDVLMPKGAVVKVKLQDRVVAGETILAVCDGIAA